MYVSFDFSVKFDNGLTRDADALELELEDSSLIIILNTFLLEFFLI